jgi:predicted DNA-binding protein
MKSPVYTKPVILFRFPVNENLSKEKLESIYENLEKRLGDAYYVLAIIENSVEKMEVEVFNATGAEVVDIEKLKTELKTTLETLQTID